MPGWRREVRDVASRAPRQAVNLWPTLIVEMLFMSNISKGLFLLVIRIVVLDFFLMHGTTKDILGGWWPLRNGWWHNYPLF